MKLMTLEINYQQSTIKQLINFDTRINEAAQVAWPPKGGMLLTSLPNWKREFPDLAKNSLADQIAIKYVTNDGVRKPVIFMLATGADTPKKIYNLALSLGFSDKNSKLIAKSFPTRDNGQFAENLYQSISLGFPNDELISKIAKSTYSWESSSFTDTPKLTPGSYKTRVTDIAPVKLTPDRTQADVEKDVNSAQNQLNTYLASLQENQKMEFFRAWQALDNPNIHISQDATRVQASLTLNNAREYSAAAHTSDVQINAEKYQAIFSKLQQESTNIRWKEQQHDIAIRIGGVGDLVIAGGSLFFAFLTAETGVGLATGIYMFYEFGTSGIAKIARGADYDGLSLTSFGVEYGVNALNLTDSPQKSHEIGVRVAMVPRAFVPGATAVKSGQYALNAFSTTGAIANTAFAIDNAAQASTQLYNAATGAHSTVPWWDGATHTFGELPLAVAGLVKSGLQFKVMNNEPINQMRDVRDFNNGTLKVTTYEATPGGSGPVVTHGRVPDKFVQIIQETNEALPTHVKQETNADTRTSNLHNIKETVKADFGKHLLPIGYYNTENGSTNINLNKFYPSGRSKYNPIRNIQDIQRHEQGRSSDFAHGFKGKSNQTSWQKAAQNLTNLLNTNSKLTQQEANVTKQLKFYDQIDWPEKIYAEVSTFYYTKTAKYGDGHPKVDVEMQAEFPSLWDAYKKVAIPKTHLE